MLLAHVNKPLVYQNRTRPPLRAQAIKKEAGGEPIEVVLHDGAPNVGGAWSSEAYSQSALVLDALKLATDVLAPRGAFVTKIFRRARRCPDPALENPSI